MLFNAGVTCAGSLRQINEAEAADITDLDTTTASPYCGHQLLNTCHLQYLYIIHELNNPHCFVMFQGFFYYLIAFLDTALCSDTRFKHHKSISQEIYLFTTNVKFFS